MRHQLFNIHKAYLLKAIWIVLIIIIFIVLYNIFNILFKHYDIQSGYYILSSITQGLAALLALLLTATLIIIQILKRFSAWKIIMSIETIGLIILYSLGIILPLIFLRIGANAKMLNASIIITLLCIIALIPFLRHISTLFINPIVLGELEFDILNARDQSAWGRVSSILQDFSYAWELVIKMKKYYEMDDCFAAWNNIKNHIVQSERVHNAIINVVVRISRRAIKENNSEYAYNVLNSYHLSDSVLNKMYLIFSLEYLNLLRFAYKKKQVKICEYIILTILTTTYRFQKLNSSLKNVFADSIIPHILKISSSLLKESLEKIRQNEVMYKYYNDILNKLGK